MNASCRHCQNALPWYPHALDASETARVAAHLTECAVCQAEWAHWQAIAAAVAVPRPGDIPHPNAHARIFAVVLPRLASPSLRETNAFHHEEESAMQLETSDQPAPPHGDSKQQSASLTHVSALAPTPHRRIWPIVSTAAIILASLVVFIALRPMYHPAHSTSLPTRTDTSISWNDDFGSVSFGAPDDGWAVGTYGTPPPGVDMVPVQPNGTSSYGGTPIMAHYADGQWRIVPAPAAIAKERIALTSVSMLSANEGWAIGRATYDAGADGPLFGVILHYANGQWTVDVTQPPTNLWHIFMLSPTNGWIVGDPVPVATDATGPTSMQGLVLHYDGHTWQEVLSAAFTEVAFHSAARDANGSLWLAGVDESGTGPDGNAPAVIVHHVGANWVRQTVPIAHARLNALAAGASGDIWAAGTILGGATKSGAADPRHPGAAAIFHLHNGIWSRQVFTDAAHTFALGFNGLALTGTDAGWAVGDQGLIAHYQQGQWHLVASPTSNDLLAVTVPPAGAGWAVGSYGMVLRESNAIWSVVTG